MAPFNPIVASLGFAHAPNSTQAAVDFMTDRSIVVHLAQNYWADFAAWIAQPSVFAVIIAWAVSFTIVVTLLLGLGFGPVGIIAGSMAAGFQSWMYGGFTPAAGVFATLTSLAMLGWLMPAVVLFAACIATTVALVVWACGVGG